MTRTFTVFLLVLAALATKAQPVIGYQTIVASGLTDPVDIAIPPNASPANGSTRVFIVQQNGIIQLWNGSALSSFLNLSSIVSTGGERGLLSMTFHPSYNGTTNREFFVYYTNTAGDLSVARYQTAVGNPLVGDAASGVAVITAIPHPVYSNHNGGDLNFGPDGFLYLSTGDGGGGGDPDENAQNPASLLGKMLRIDVTAAFPVMPVVVDIGLRNPFRWSFDKLTGDTWIGDVGQNNWEEISFKSAGASGQNFGWDCFEGSTSFEPAGCPASGFTPPSYVYPNLSGSRSVVGGYVYRGTEFPALQGYYLATDYFTGSLIMRTPGGTWSEQTPALQNGVASFGEAPDGTLYAVSQFSDDLYKLIVTAVLPVTLTSFEGRRKEGVSHLRWTTSSEHHTRSFRIEWSRTASNFGTVGRIAASRNPQGSSYFFDHQQQAAGYHYYRLAIEEDDGRIAYSGIIRLSSSVKDGIRIYPTRVNNGFVNIESNEPLEGFEMIGSAGIVLFSKTLKGNIGTISVGLPDVPKGLYLLRIKTAGRVHSQKILVE